MAVVKSTLRILAVENVGDAFNTQVGGGQGYVFVYGNSKRGTGRDSCVPQDIYGLFMSPDSRYHSTLSLVSPSHQ